MAPFSFATEVLKVLVEKLDKLEGHDDVRAAFDAWMAEIDPTGAMDEYKMARAYAGRKQVAAAQGN